MSKKNLSKNGLSVKDEHQILSSSISIARGLLATLQLGHKSDWMQKYSTTEPEHLRIVLQDVMAEIWNAQEAIDRLTTDSQVRWTDQQIAEAAKMAGLVSLRAQAKYFNRPNARTGSIKSLWAKRFGSRAASVNGMAHWQARHLVTVKATYLQARARAQRVILWVDMEKCLKSETPQFIKEAIRSLADFQRWLWKSDNPKPLILKMIREREA